MIPGDKMNYCDGAAGLEFTSLRTYNEWMGNFSGFQQQSAGFCRLAKTVHRKAEESWRGFS